MSETDCGSNATCENTLGSYSCPCKPGFTGEGLSCTGKYILPKIVSRIIKSEVQYRGVVLQKLDICH